MAINNEFMFKCLIFVKHNSRFIEEDDSKL